MSELPTWNGRITASHGDAQDLGSHASTLVQRGVPSDEAVERAYSLYRAQKLREAAAHHLSGLKDAQRLGNTEQARKHGLMYRIILKELGYNPNDSVPHDIQALQGKTQKLHSFRAHPGDALLFKAEDFAKKVLDPGAGYKISHQHQDFGDSAMTRVHAHDAAGNHVGAAMFRHEGHSLVPLTVAVDDDHQRRGLASAMYAHAEAQTGKKIVPSKLQTDEGVAFWAGSGGKQFGR